ncbi:MAG: hypothetical protein KAQ71_00625 [Desulfobulbaceae bacterium]|nr:hypothetical protein [Desulfobulbaceae bacterium]
MNKEGCFTLCGRVKHGADNHEQVRGEEKMKRETRTLIAAGAALLFSGIAGPETVAAGDFDRFHMPISNPIYHGDARNVTMVRPIILRQEIPDKIKINLAGTKTKLDAGGEINGVALQFSYAFNDRLSLVAVKDGYVDCKLDHNTNLIPDHNGLVDIAAGMQYSFIYQPENDFIMTGRLVFEFPSGDDEAYQGNGDGTFAPSILFLKGWNNLQFSGTIGAIIPIDDDEENTMLYDSWHLSYIGADWFRPLVEINHFHVLSSGNRDLSAWDGTGDDHHDLVAGVARFNPCDIINLGGEHNDDFPNLVTMALGARFRVTDWLDLGASYEFPLTDKEETLLKKRVLLDAMITFNF